VNKARLIALDWGSTRLRAMLVDAGGALIEARHSGQGASAISGGPAAFSAALDALIGDWHGLGLPALACGMVGSQHGWREVPYARCPADAAALVGGALAVDWRGQAVHLLPGLRCDTEAGPADVMRGEETQVLGALALAPGLAERACIVLPGTHAKWAQVAGGVVRSFATHMTGELFALLRQHSVLGRLMPAETADDPTAFAEGVGAAREHGALGLSHQLFAVRTLALTGQRPASAMPDYLSGLLIGHELRAALPACGDAPLALVGEPALCQRYAQALQLFGTAPPQLLDNTAAAGLWRLAQGLQGFTQ